MAEIVSVDCGFFFLVEEYQLICPPLWECILVVRTRLKKGSQNTLQVTVASHRLLFVEVPPSTTAFLLKFIIRDGLGLNHVLVKQL